MRVAVDRDRCAGHGRCYLLAPELFTDDDIGYGQVVGDGEVPEGRRDLAARAVAGCPEGAVVVEGE